MIKTLKITYYLMGILFMAWIFFSWFDVIANNVSPNPVFHPWNLFTMLVGM